MKNKYATQVGAQLTLLRLIDGANQASKDEFQTLASQYKAHFIESLGVIVRFDGAFGSFNHGLIRTIDDMSFTSFYLEYLDEFFTPEIGSTAGSIPHQRNRARDIARKLVRGRSQIRTLLVLAGWRMAFQVSGATQYQFAYYCGSRDRTSRK